jgi:photosystem II stability/assembly factor-like uncharacterized protein
MSQSTSLRILVLAVLATFLLTAGTGAVYAVTWQPAGPDGGTVVALAVDPTDPDIVYAGTQLGPLFKTTDGGESWHALHGFPTGSVGSLAIDPAHPRTLYAAVSYAGVYRSLDGGETWKAVWTNINEWVEAGIRIDSRGFVYVLFGRGLLRSQDGGESWRWNRPTGSRLTSLALDPIQPGVLYVAPDIGPIVRSDDAGRTWRRFGRPFAQSSLVTSFAVEPGRRQQRRVHVSTSQGLLRSLDGGFTWQASVELQDRQADRVIAAGGVLYALLERRTTWEGRGSLLRSLDGGETWEPAGAGLSAMSFSALAVAPSDPRTLYVGPTQQGVFRSRDGAETWTRASRGLAPLDVLRLATDPARPGRLLLATLGAGVLTTVDGGATWPPADPRPSHLFYTVGLKVEPKPPSRAFAASPDHRVRSDNGGITWRTLGPPGFDGVFALDPDHPGTLYASTVGAFERSQDAGETWKPVADPLACLYVTWVEVVPGSGTVVVSAYERTPGCSGRGGDGFYRSKDGGATWTKLPNSLPWTGVLATDSASPGVLYMVGFGVAKSTDDGDTWTTSAPFPGANALGLVFLATPDAFYVGGGDNAGGEVWVSHDQGASWSKIGGPIRGTSVSGLALDQGVLWAGTYGGLYRLDLD